MAKKKPHTDLRILRTRQLIKDAFVELLEEMDLQKITVNRLAERATINRVTFYLHYRDIPDMLEKMADDMIDDISTIFSNTQTDQISSDEISWEIIGNLLEHIAEHSNFYKNILASNKVPIFRERLTMFLRESIVTKIEERGKSSHILTDTVKEDILIWYETSALIGTIISWLQNNMPYTPAFLAQQFSLLHHRGLNEES
ncbi:TetR family transcriptional regulator C-terminal domain-containing protein [Bacillus spizizenii]|uniref:TetR/AcrR family transcriptional regulator n=1 Tax=Bacillus spizizenii TaxID=96241 RepID=UPI0022824225|nr:TetR-like C-terminal domain-containing protein [Bacillus spizizenii]MCY7885261.1 TetR family transcriptional regulator C-terminal domain-containing protein [Bacillus spizizenii]MCY8411928.1 TetR family transcriptional regulator C-terminal domain-containing protein [Bacillus spizizenii]MCY8427147.1 TetR family transcriptional regulator C-terminal domain-containing protein [Bacillus spizizenii]MCY8442919.1 TetR family transcriptional regulator C-terminal domain-containing protein [Bacillus spi